MRGNGLTEEVEHLGGRVVDVERVAGLDTNTQTDMRVSYRRHWLPSGFSKDIFPMGA